MALLHAVEDRPTPQEVYNWRLYSEAIIIATGSFLFGYDGAFIGTTLARSSFIRDFHINKSNESAISSNITSAFQAGAFFGALFCFFITERIGRKWALQCNIIVFNIGAVLMTAATHQLGLIYTGRVLAGLGCGRITATVPSYIAELSIPSIRGILTGFFELAYQIGSVIGFWINYGIDQNMTGTLTSTWRIPMAFQLVPGGLVLIGGFFLDESPLWLMRKERNDEANKVLEKLRHIPVEHRYVQEEIQMIQVKLSEEAAIAMRYGQGKWAFFRGAMKEFSQKGMRNRVWLVFWAFTLCNYSGAAAINYYSPTLFKSIGITDITLYTGIYGLVKAIASILYYIFVIDSVGRRMPVIISSVACSMALWYIGAYVKIAHPSTILDVGGTLSKSSKEGGQAATAMIMIYAVFWSFGLNGIPWIVSAEIFPGALRNLSGTWAALVMWATQFSISKALPYIFDSMGYGTWFFFASFMFVATLWAYFFLPETKGLTLDQMNNIFGYEGETTAAMLEANLLKTQPQYSNQKESRQSQHRDIVH